MKWRELLESASEQLQLAGISDARTNAEWLAASVLHVWTSSEVLREAGREVLPEEVSNFESLIQRRLQHEPLQYIIGETEFFGLRLFTTPAALIPRPETEILVEEALLQLENFSDKMPIRILDVGTGTGAIALAIASKWPAAEILGIDKSGEAIALAEQNRKRLGLKNVEFRLLDLFDKEIVAKLGKPFDLLVSNPPYISIAEMEMLDPEILEHEPRIALTDEGNGLQFYKRIAELRHDLLEKNGALVVELSFDGLKPVTEIMQGKNIVTDRIVKDLSGVDRVFVGH